MIFISRYVLHVKNTQDSTRNFCKPDKSTFSISSNKKKNAVYKTTQQETKTVFSYINDEGAEGKTGQKLKLVYLSSSKPGGAT